MEKLSINKFKDFKLNKNEMNFLLAGEETCTGGGIFCHLR